MVKFKKGLSDKVRGKLKSKSKPQQVNPFEIKVNKVKHTVVNKKVEKWEKGLPGVSRSKAIKKRKDTILNELRQMKKSNSLHDKRIGEKDSNLSAEEKMVQRFAMERKMRTSKQDAFNLNEEEVILTHYGQSLAENLKDKPDSDSDDDDYHTQRENTGKFQFGGFSLEEDEFKWKDKMKEVIADSKKQKYERQMEKEKSYEATKELDGLWKSIVCKMKPQNRDAPSTKQISPFIMLSRSLVMEQKSDGASDKLKSEEQKAKEENEKLKKLEAQRLKRMRGEEKVIISDHVSADSLTNGYAVNKKGKLKVSFATDGSDEEEKDEKSDESGEDESEDGEEDEGSDENSESDDEDNYSDLEDDGEGGDDNDDEDDDDEDDDDEEKEGEEDESKKTSKQQPASILKISKPVHMSTTPAQGSDTSEIPFVFDAPETFEDLQSLLSSHSASDQITVISRLRKCHHPSLSEDNKEKLKKIHLFLLQYYAEKARGRDVDKVLMDGLTSQLFEMTQTFPQATAKFLQGIVLERQKEFTAVAERRGRGFFPSVDTLAYLRLVEMLFPTSDYRHEVTTPSIHFMAQTLAESSVKTLKDVTCGLYLCALCLQYVRSSKRYVSEVITFLHGVLYLAADSSKSEKSHTFPPLRKANKDSCQLELKEKCDHVSPHLSLSHVVNSDSELSEQDANNLKCDLIRVCIELLDESLKIWKDLPCLALVLQPVDAQLKFLPSHFYAAALKDKVSSLISKIEEARKTKFVAMQHASKRPEPLALFEPKVQENWEGKRKKGASNRDANNRQRLLHKYKREMKSAVREIKRDNAVLAKHKLDITLQKDAERKRKVKDIMSSLSAQEGDYKAIKRGKP